MHAARTDSPPDHDCRVCGAPLPAPFLALPGPRSLTSLCGTHPGPTIASLCDVCGHVQSPAMQDASEYYASAYRILIDSEDEDQVVDFVDGRPRFRTGVQLAALRAAAEPPHAARVLDFGCAKASTLRALLAARPDLQGHAFDVSDMWRPFWARFLPADRCATHALPPRWHRGFDLVTSFFAFEHVIDVREAARAVAALLRPGGVFHWVVPDPLANASDLVVVDHAQHFTAPSARRLMADAGFADTRVDSASHPGAIVVTATRADGPQPASALDAGERQALAASLKAIAARWRATPARIAEFEAALPADARPAIYGSSFYGSYIASRLVDPSRIRCFVDRNPHFQGRSVLGRPVVAPEAVPADVDALYVGLNPVHARAAIAQVPALAAQARSTFWL